MVQVFIYIHNLCMRAATTLVNLPICAGLFEPFMLNNAISAQIPCAGSFCKNGSSQVLNPIYGLNNLTLYSLGYI